MKPINLSEPTIYFIDAVKIFIFWILSKLDFPYRSKSVKEISEKIEILILITLRSSKVFRYCCRRDNLDKSV